MLSWGDDLEIHALHERGWTISAIARHTGFDRKTVRAYLTGKRQPGQHAKPAQWAPASPANRLPGGTRPCG